jgi:hypothetical protein
MRISLLCGALGLWFLACKVTVTPGYIEDDKKTAGLAIATLHEPYNASKYEAIWNSAHPAFQSAQTKDASLASMRQSAQNFGRFERVLECRMNVLVRAPIEIRAVCNSQFERAVGAEMFTYVKVGTQVQLAHYALAPGPATLPAEQ